MSVFSTNQRDVSVRWKDLEEMPIVSVDEQGSRASFVYLDAAMFWPFIEIEGELTYCPLADFGSRNLREGRDIYGKAVVAQPLTAHLPLHNATQINGKIAVVERGQCDFVTKVLHAQSAGAIAVLVANTSRENPSEAFIMDAGRRTAQEIAAIRIPAMMISYAKATNLFEQLRECYLDRRELSMTVKFLGAQTSAYVLEQIETAARKRVRQAHSIQLQHEREQHQQEAAMLLRKRLGKPSEVEEAGPQLVASPASTDCTPAKLESPRPSLPSPTNQTQCQFEDSMDTLSLASSYEAAPRQSSLLKSPQLNHWCPMTTALLILDVQNYFALPQNEHLHGSSIGGGTDFYKRINHLMVPNIQDILLACRACDGIEIIYSIVESMTKDGRERSRAHKHAGVHVARGGFGAQVLPRVGPTEDDIVIPRTGTNLFDSTNIDYVLRNLGVSHLVVVGLSVLRSIPLCVQTALDRGYQVTLVKDAITAESQQTLDEQLLQSEQLGCQVISSAAFVADIHGYASAATSSQDDEQ